MKAMKKLALAALFLLPTLASAQSVDLLYQGQTYAPPFYRGGSLWSGESNIVLFAVPQGLGDPASLTYKWRQGTTVIGNASGVGKNVLVFSDNIFSRPQIFSVQIIDNDDNVIAQAVASVSPTAPSLLVYEKNPLYGFLFNREVSDTYPLSGQEATFGAFPLFFSAQSRNDGATAYEWKSSAGSKDRGSEVTYRVPDAAVGQASVSVAASNPATVRQQASRNFLVQFGHEQ